jgi:hypothetical protein
MPAFSLYVDEETYQKLLEMKKKHPKSSIQDIVRMILKEYFKMIEKEKKEVKK